MKVTNDVGDIDKSLTYKEATPSAGTTSIGPYKLGGVPSSGLGNLFPGGTVSDGRLQVVFCEAADAALVKAAADGERLGIDVTLFEDDGTTVRAQSSGFYTASGGEGLPAFSPEVEFPAGIGFGLATVTVTVPTTGSALSEVSVAWKPDDY